MSVNLSKFPVPRKLTLLGFSIHRADHYPRSSDFPETVPAHAQSAHSLHAVPASVFGDFVWEEPLRCGLREKTTRLVSEAQWNSSQSLVPEQKDEMEEAGVGEPTRLEQGSPYPLREPKGPRPLSQIGPQFRFSTEPHWQKLVVYLSGLGNAVIKRNWSKSSGMTITATS